MTWRTVAVSASVVLVAAVVIWISWFGGAFTIPAAIIAAAITVTGGLLVQTWLSNLQNRRSIEERLRERKSEVYEAFIKFWMDELMLPASQQRHARGEVSQEELAGKINDLSKAMMLWASNDVVQAYADFRRRLQQTPTGNVSPAEVLDQHLRFERMLFLMREDMGHDRGGFREKDLLAFYIKDIVAWERGAANLPASMNNVDSVL